MILGCSRFGFPLWRDDYEPGCLRLHYTGASWSRHCAASSLSISCFGGNEDVTSGSPIKNKRATLLQSFLVSGCSGL